MATHTSRYNLSKPENTDEMQSFMSDYADNMDKIDENLGGGGGSANIVELTQAEYDALPDSKLSNDTMYLIKDAVSASDAEFTNVYGFYIDETNKLFEGTMTNFTQTLEYTATEDAIAFVDYTGSSGTNQWFFINDVTIPLQVTSGNRENYAVPIRKGDKISARHTSDNEGCYFHLVVYGVKTGSEITIIPDYASACYSTQEREVGCFVDGKPLYQKSIVIGSLPNATETGYPHGISNIESVVDIFGIANDANGNSIPIIFANPASNVSQITAYRSGANIYVGTGLDRSGYSGYVTLRYTKTTDVAGSGNWAPLGKPTVHYSTEETCIGTWVDGKPLYQKTISFNGITLSANTAYAFDFSSYITNYDKVFFIHDMSYYIINGTTQRNFVYPNSSPVQPPYIILGVEVNRSNISGYLTVRYTKTTD